MNTDKHGFLSRKKKSRRRKKDPEFWDKVHAWWIPLGNGAFMKPRILGQ
jgi:hypothetical protein